MPLSEAENNKSLQVSAFGTLVEPIERMQHVARLVPVENKRLWCCLSVVWTCYFGYGINGYLCPVK